MFLFLSHHPDHLPLVLFWYDVIDYNENEKNTNDKSSRIQHAWAIYNSYLSPTARFNIGLPLDYTNQIRSDLQKQQIDTSVFTSVVENLIPYLQKVWLDYIKEDVMKYTE